MDHLDFLKKACCVATKKCKKIGLDIDFAKRLLLRKCNSGNWCLVLALDGKCNKYTYVLQALSNNEGCKIFIPWYVEIIDPCKYICPNETCPAINENLSNDVLERILRAMANGSFVILDSPDIDKINTEIDKLNKLIKSYEEDYKKYFGAKDISQLCHINKLIIDCAEKINELSDKREVEISLVPKGRSCLEECAMQLDLEDVE